MKRARVVVLCCVVLLVTVISNWAEGVDRMSSEITITNWDMDEYEPDVAYNSKHDEYFVVWYDDAPGFPWTVMGRRYTAAGVYLDQYTIAYDDSPANNKDNIEPSVAYDPARDRYLVVWSHDALGDWSDWDIHARFVPWNGLVPAQSAFAVYQGQGGSDERRPRVAFGGTNDEWMVTWDVPGANRKVQAIRLSASGAAVGGLITVNDDSTDPPITPDIAFNQARNEYLIVYEKLASSAEIYGVRFDKDGNALAGGEFGIATWPNHEVAPRIAASRISNTWAVAWSSVIETGNEDVFVRTISVDGTGTIQFSPPVNPGTTSGYDSYPDIGAHPESSNFMVTWQVEYDLPGGEYGIWSQVLNADGTLGAKFRPRELWAGETHDCRLPAVAGGVNDWMVVWQHGRDGTPTYEDIHGRVLFADILADGFESNDTTGWSSTTP